MSDTIQLENYSKVICVWATLQTTPTNQYLQEKTDKMTAVNEESHAQRSSGHNLQSLCLPALDSNDQEATCIASWAVLIRDYFSQECPSFACLKPHGHKPASWDFGSGNLKESQISLSLDGQDTTADLTKRIRNDLLEYSQMCSGKHENDTAVLIFDTNNSENEIFHDEAIRLMELIKVRIEQHETTNLTNKMQGRYFRGHADRT